MNPNRIPIKRIVLSAVLTALSVASPYALGQQPAEKGKSPPLVAEDKPHDFVVIHLKHVAATEMAGSIKSTFAVERGSPMTVAADDRTNSLILAAPKARLEIAKALIQQLDVAAPKPLESGRKLHTFQLQDRAEKPLLELAAMLLGKQDRVALDPAKRNLLLYSDERVARDVAELLTRVGRATPAVESDVQIRVVCLIDSSKDENDHPLPSDLADIQQVLAKVGIKKAMVGGQVIVRAATDGRFQAAGTISAHPLEGPLNATGTYRRDGSKLQIEINVGKEKILAQISATISAPLGHMILLGATPAKDTTAVFLIQVSNAN